MTDEAPKPNGHDGLMFANDVDDSEQDIDVVVGGELITSTAVLINESSFKPAKERGWLSAITSANAKSDVPEQQRLQNVREIAKEAIRRGVLTEQQVNERLTELRIGDPTPENATKQESQNKQSVQQLARELAAQTNGMTREQITAHPDLLQKEQELQTAVTKYKQVLIAAGHTADQASALILQTLQETGLQFQRNRDAAPSPDEPKQPENQSSFPAIDYDAIARAIPLDENNPPKPNEFMKPVVTNMFAEDDEATLTGKMVGSLYDKLIKRTDAKRYNSTEVQQLLALSRQTKVDFAKTVEAVNQARQAKGLPPLDMGDQRQSGRDGFHFNGEGRPSSDFLFYFGKSRANYKKSGEPEVRAYVTLKPEEMVNNQAHFVALSIRLYDAGVDFSAKAGSIFGVQQRTDNMVFYISASDQPRASQIIKDFLQEKGVGQGKMLAALASPQEGLSWAMQPDQKGMQLWKDASGSTVDASYNVLVAIKAMPAYLDRLVLAHQKKGDQVSAQQFEQEAKRLRAIIQAA